ncbi:MAG: NUDIX domain-containing protein, partial [Gammaproteobacteria bacterium]
QKPQRVDLREESRISSGYLKIDRYQLRHERYLGDWTETLSREVMDRGAVGAVLPFDPFRQEVILIEQFRIGAWAAGWPEPWLLECVAGVIEKDETPEALAIREAREEAGCEITRLEPIARYFSTPGACSERVHLFCGQVDTSSAGGIHGLETEHEDIFACVWPLKDALALLHRGEVSNSMTLIALQWLDRHHEDISHRWRATA